MPRNFISMNKEEVNTKIAEAIRAREAELSAYDFELAGHEANITALGNISWSPETQKYKGMKRDQMIIAALADGLSQEQVMAISDLLALDMHRHELMAVRVEIAKSERHYQNLLNALPESERAAAFAALDAK